VFRIFRFVFTSLRWLIGLPWRRRWVAFVVAVLVLVFVSVETLTTTVAVSTVTEFCHFSVDGGDVPAWNLDSALLVRDFNTDGEPFTGTFLVAEGATCTATRRGMENLRLRCLSGDGSSQAPVAYTKVSDGDRRILARGRVVLILAPTTRQPTISLAVVGPLEVGRDRVEPDGAILRSGTISLLARTFFSGDVFLARTVEVSLGDSIQIPGNGESAGVIVVNENPAMAVAYRRVGATAVVRRFGGTGYPVSVPIFVGITNELSLRALWTAMGFVTVWVTVWAGRSLRGRPANR
jgi:hypothetical protein